MSERRRDDARLLDLVGALDLELGMRLRELIEAPEGAAAFIEERNRANRADDLAQECRRQLHSMIRQVDQLRAASTTGASDE